MADRHDVALREVGAQNPPGLLERIREQLNEHLPAVLGDGGSWLRGRSAQELAKAEEIRARVVSELGTLENERLRLLHEREQAMARQDHDRHTADLAHRERMYELRTQRVKAIGEAVAAFKELKDLGVEIQLDLIASRLLSIIDEE